MFCETSIYFLICFADYLQALNDKVPKDELRLYKQSYLDAYWAHTTFLEIL